ADDEGQVGRVAHGLVLDFVVFQQVSYDPAQEDDISTRAYGGIEVSDRRRSRETRVDNDQSGVVVRFGVGDPLEPTGVCFGGVTAHNQDYIGVLDVDPMVRHRSTAKRRGKTCHRRAVSDTSLVIECEPAEAAENLMSDVGDFVRTG